MKTIHHVFEIAAPPGKIFAALTTADGLSGWWTTKVSAQAGIGAVVDFTFGGDFKPRYPARLPLTHAHGSQQWPRAGTALPDGLRRM